MTTYTAAVAELETQFSAVQTGPFRDTGEHSYNVLAAGVKADGKVVSDAACTSGSAVVTSASATFTSADIGKLCWLGGTSVTNTESLRTTILSVQSATQVTLSATASYSGTAQRFAYGTDNAAAMQGVLDTHDYVFFPAGGYVLGSTLTLRSATRIAGAGMDLTSLHSFPSGNGVSGLTLDGVVGVLLEHFTIVGYGGRGVLSGGAYVKVQKFTGCACVLIRDSSRVTCSHVAVQGGSVGFWHDNTADSIGSGVWTTNTDHLTTACRASYTAGGSFYIIRADNCKWLDCHAVHAGSDGFKVQRVSRNCSFMQISSRGNGRDGMDTYDGLTQGTVDGAVFTDNTAFGVEFKGLYSSSLGDYVTREVTIANIETARNGDCGMSVTSVRNSTFINVCSTSDDFVPYGETPGEVEELASVPASIRFSNCQNLTLSNLVASKGKHNGIAFEHCSEIVGTALLAMDNSWVDGVTQNGTYHGVYFSSTSGRLSLTEVRSGNSISSQQGGQGYAVYFADGTAANRIISLNARGCVTGMYYDSLAANFVSQTVNETALLATGWRHVPYVGTGTHAGATAPITRLVHTPKALAANNASPDAPESNVLYTANTAPTNLSALGGGVDGMIVHIHVRDSNTTLMHLAPGGGNFKVLGGTNRLAALDSVITLIYFAVDSKWHEA